MDKSLLVLGFAALNSCGNPQQSAIAPAPIQASKAPTSHQKHAQTQASAKSSTKDLSRMNHRELLYCLTGTSYAMPLECAAVAVREDVCRTKVEDEIVEDFKDLNARCREAQDLANKTPRTEKEENELHFAKTGCLFELNHQGKIHDFPIAAEEQKTCATEIDELRNCLIQQIVKVGGKCVKG